MTVEELAETYARAFDAALPSIPSSDNHKRRLADLSAHAAATAALVKALLAETVSAPRA